MTDPAALLRRLAPADPDADLLARFTADRDAAAFAELVRRHGPVVHRVCRRLLGPGADADAFQATFLVLATRPGAVRTPGAVGSWLVGVADRVARQIARAERRRRSHEAAAARDPHARPDPAAGEELRILDEELARLPDRLRGPVVACLLQGRTQEQAAAELGGSVRTVRRRLDEAKRLLRRRLERRGVVPSVAAGLVAVVGDGVAAVPAGLAARTVAAAGDLLAGAASAARPAVVARRVTMGTVAGKVRLTFAVALGLTALGFGLAGGQPAAPPAPPAPPPPAPVAAPADPGAHRTANFVVRTPLPAISRAVGAELEYQRAEQARKWLGRELPPWPEPAEVRLAPVPDHSLGGRIDGEVIIRHGPGGEYRFPFRGELAPLLSNTQWGMARVVFATHVGKDLPPWVDSGALRHALPPDFANMVTHQGVYEACADALATGQALRLKVLFEADAAAAKSKWELVGNQGYGVGKFLLARGTPPDLLRFIRRGREDGWDAAARAVYGFDTVDRMEEAWVAWVRQNPPPRRGPPDPTRIPRPGFTEGPR